MSRVGKHSSLGILSFLNIIFKHLLEIIELYNIYTHRHMDTYVYTYTLVSRRFPKMVVPNHPVTRPWTSKFSKPWDHVGSPGWNFNARNPRVYAVTCSNHHSHIFISLLSICLLLFVYLLSIYQFSFIYLSIHFCLSIHFFIYWFIHVVIFHFLFIVIYSFIHSFVRSFIHSFMYSFSHLFVCSCMYIRTYIICVHLFCLFSLSSCAIYVYMCLFI